MKNTTLIILIVVASILLSFWQGCEYAKNQIKQAPLPDSTGTIKIVYDTNWYTPTPTKAKPELVHDTLYIPITTVIDTASVIRQYFTQSVYVDTFQDKNILIAIKDTLFKNQITGRALHYRILRPDSIITITIRESNVAATKSKTSIAAGTSFNFTTKNVLPGIAVKRNNIIIGYHTNLTEHQLNLYYQLWH